VFGYYLFIIIILLLSVLPNIYDLLLLGFMVVILITPLMDVMLWVGYCCYVVLCAIYTKYARFKFLIFVCW